MSAAHKTPGPLARRPAAWCRGRLLVVAALLSLLFVPARAADDEDEDEDKTPPLPKDVAEIARKYAGVTEWRGFFEASMTGSQANNGPKFSLARHSEARTSGQFTLKLTSDGAEAKRGEFQWGGINTVQSGEATGSEFDEWSERDDIYGTSMEWRSELSGTVPLFAVRFDINLLKQNGGVHMGFTPDHLLLKKTKTGHAVTYLSSDNGKPRHGAEIINEESMANLHTPEIRSGFPIDREYALREWAVVRNGPGVLTFVYGRADPIKNDKDMIYTYRSRITLVPVYDELELEVTIDGYAKWRPKGSIKPPQEPGNSLVARATLKSKTGKLKELPAVKRFKFELLDTSREPGVCLNWPLGAKDEDYDLRFAADGGGKLSDLGQKLSLTDSAQDDKGQAYAEATVNSYDFGGRATLQVLCELEDGREIMGLMKGEGGEEDLVRLPKMNGPGWIADSWRKEKKAEKLADNDDNEKVDGQKDNGDGFTLYEEYRGWVENGKHIEGDPEGKDFFVLNMIGADGRPGIELFATLSKLRVHSKLRRWEMSQDDRLMNGNHRDAPHRPEGQHGVWVKTYTRSDLGDTGAATRMAKGGVAGRPGTTLRIGILARNNTESIFNQPFNLPPQDAIFAFDRAIAHELLHSVGVDHHGPDDTVGYALSFIPPNVPGNKVGRPHYLTSDNIVVNLLEENGHDVAAQTYPVYVKTLELLKASGLGTLIESLYGKSFPDKPAGSPAFKAWVDEYVGHLSRAGFGMKGMVGQEHFSHSGDQDCVMRYYFAEFYDAKNTKGKTVYLVTRGTERIGMEICHSGKGTGVNAPKPPNLPQSRYGDAAVGAGNCFEQICPNDAIPPRSGKK